LLRGTPSEVTLYSRNRSVCTLNGANFAIYSVSIGSTLIDAASGDWKDQRSISVTLATTGTVTAACADSFAANLEVTGGWVAGVTPLSRLVSAGQLSYMCIDQKAAYAPTETWQRTNGANCTCSLSHAVSCLAP
ncbi:MAG: hypothetical protein ABW061_28195, partial [Polyangiaceae bacterium]